MPSQKKIVVIIGSASENSSNQKLMEQILKKRESTDFQMYNNLSFLPHFDTAITDENIPDEVLKIREDIKNSAGVIFSTPEYIFSIPGRLKNLLEWCVSTTVFSEKPVAVITASASGEKGHEELLMILKTLGAVTDDKHQALIKGIKGKFDSNGLLESNTFAKVSKLVADFTTSVS
ncbi:NAD(P)H-dependent oxidoreductase (plasmid) [Chryseobacterium panacisoli]|uniref:NAD(P)H-dependent oxidoreductase n=1 Tax=Chryseobacterium panacisoli TaxID=1807141 RepID=A0A5D8ZZH4_9FLAO|nr:NAD(P)H-dependent oxidoreductase [Chryseobacterium panacisoli]TZF99951.1 NAD(P)H-dependent oxidoreductase [Chryseobacterium panacisoli]